MLVFICLEQSIVIRFLKGYKISDNIVEVCQKGHSELGMESLFPTEDTVHRTPSEKQVQHDCSSNPIHSTKYPAVYQLIIDIHFLLL
jgi:hypothetical protein